MQKNKIDPIDPIDPISPVVASRRRFLQMAGLGGLAAAISACSSGEPAEPTDAPVAAPTAEPLPTRASESSAQNTQDTSASQATPNATRVKPAYDASLANVWIAVTSDPRFCDRFDIMADGFASDNSGLRINAMQCDGTGENFLTLWKSRMEQAQPPDAAIVFDNVLQELLTGNVLEPMDDLMGTSTYSAANAWPSNLLNIATQQGKTYGLPLFVAPFALYYNAGAFEKKGISAKREDFPKTWDELKRLSKEFTTWSGDSLKSAGYIPNLNSSELLLMFALNGGGLFDAASNKYVIDQQRNVEMLQFILGWYREQYRGDIVKIRNSGEFLAENTFAELPKSFQRGTLAMARGSILASDFLASQPLAEEAKSWDVAPFPIGPSGKETVTQGNIIWAIQPSNAKHRDAAFKYVDYVGGKGVAGELAFDFGTFIPGNKSIAKPQASKMVEKVRGEAFATDWLNFFLKQRDLVTTFDTSPLAGLASDVLSLQMDDITRGKISPSEGLRQTQKICQDKLEQATKK